MTHAACIEDSDGAERDTASLDSITANATMDGNDGWIAPSLEHKKDIHIQAISRINKVIPLTDITMEMGNFDTQVLKEGSHYRKAQIISMANVTELQHFAKQFLPVMAIHVSAATGQ